MAVTYTDADLEHLDYFELQCDGACTIDLARWHDVNMDAPTMRDIEAIIDEHGSNVADFTQDEGTTGPYTWVQLYQWLGY